MCDHIWVNTGLNYTFCKLCDVTGDWRGSEVILRRPSKTFPHNLFAFGLPLEYSSFRASEKWGQVILECFDVFVEKAVGELAAGSYVSLRIEESVMNPDTLLVSALGEYTGWQTVPCANRESYEQFVRGLVAPSPVSIP